MVAEKHHLTSQAKPFMRSLACTFLRQEADFPAAYQSEQQSMVVLILLLVTGVSSTEGAFHHNHLQHRMESGIHTLQCGWERCAPPNEILANSFAILVDQKSRTFRQAIAL